MWFVAFWFSTIFTKKGQLLWYPLSFNYKHFFENWQAVVSFYNWVDCLFFRFKWRGFLEKVSRLLLAISKGKSFTIYLFCQGIQGKKRCSGYSFIPLETHKDYPHTDLVCKASYYVLALSLEAYFRFLIKNTKTYLHKNLNLICIKQCCTISIVTKKKKINFITN